MSTRSNIHSALSSGARRRMARRDRRRTPGGRLRVVGIGGGTGLPVLLNGLKQLNGADGSAIDITAIVAVSDSGGSSGALRLALSMPAMGDVRNCLVALSRCNPQLASICSHRFENAEGLAGHSVGNLILSALYQMSGDFAVAVRRASDLLNLDGRVLPATGVPLTLCAEYDDGAIVSGEANLTRAGCRVKRIWVHPSDPLPSPGVLHVLREADVIVLGPGSLYTSIIANLLVGGVARAIHESPALRIYVCNLAPQSGETDGFSTADHLRAIQSYLPPATIDACIFNRSEAGIEADIRRMGVTPVSAPLINAGETPHRHDPETLARLVVSLARDGATPAGCESPEILQKCGT